MVLGARAREIDRGVSVLTEWWTGGSRLDGVFRWNCRDSGGFSGGIAGIGSGGLRWNCGDSGGFRGRGFCFSISSPFLRILGSSTPVRARAGKENLDFW